MNGNKRLYPIEYDPTLNLSEGSCFFVIEFKMFTDTCVNKVWSQDKSDVDMFMKQHNIPNDNIRKYIIPSSDKQAVLKYINDDEMLEPFFFASNKDNKVHMVMTTQSILQYSLMSICYDMAASMMFGDAILRNDIKIINRINDLIQELDYAAVYDWDIADEMVDSYYSCDDYDDEVEEIDDCCSDTSYTYEELFKASMNHGNVEALSLEGYVHYFTSTSLEKIGDKTWQKSRNHYLR